MSVRLQYSRTCAAREQVSVSGDGGKSCDQCDA